MAREEPSDAPVPVPVPPVSPAPAGEPEPPSALRAIPAVHRLVEVVADSPRAAGTPRSLILEAARATLEEYRAELEACEDDMAEAPTLEAIAERVTERLERERRPPLAPAINATGVIIHTGLGRAPWPEAAVAAAAEVARGYAPVEIDLASGGRGRRSAIVRSLLCQLTGAETATVVNNNAAALMLVLAALARERGVIVSRGELVEIGGSFRLPDVMAAGGAILREVGTTNRTRLSDYRRAIDDSTAVLLKVHTSNYRIEGFTEAVPLEALVALAHEHELAVVHDIGSGLLNRAEGLPLPPGEPAAAESIAAGADLVLFSGDKLLGGPQAGIIAGRAELVEIVQRHPMMRAMRVDKVTLAALGAVLQLHRDAEQAVRDIPVHALIATPLTDLERRGRALVASLRGLPGARSVELRAAQAYIGGGSVPAEALPSCAVVIEPAGGSEEDMARRLRLGDPAVVGRVKEGRLWLDLRAVLAGQDGPLLAALTAALA